MAADDLDFLRIAKLLNADVVRGRRTKFGGMNAFVAYEAAKARQPARHLEATPSADIMFAAVEEFEKVRDGYELDRVLVDPELSHALMSNLRDRGVTLDVERVFRGLQAVRKAGIYGLSFKKCTNPAGLHVDDVVPKAEVAFGQLRREVRATVDSVVTDPFVAKRYDQIFATLDSKTSTLRGRWALLRLRKQRYLAATRLDIVRESDPEEIESYLPKFQPVAAVEVERIPEQNGYFALVSGKDSYLYVGHSTDVRHAATLFCEPQTYVKLSRLVGDLLPIDPKQLKFSSITGRSNARYDGLTAKEAAMSLIAHRQPYLNVLSHQLKEAA